MYATSASTYVINVTEVKTAILGEKQQSISWRSLDDHLVMTYHQRERYPLRFVLVSVDDLHHAHVNQVESKAEPSQHSVEGILQQLGRSQPTEKAVPFGEQEQQETDDQKGGDHQPMNSRVEGHPQRRFGEIVLVEQGRWQAEGNQRWENKVLQRFVQLRLGQQEVVLLHFVVHEADEHSSEVA